MENEKVLYVVYWRRNTEGYSEIPYTQECFRGIESHNLELFVNGIQSSSLFNQKTDYIAIYPQVGLLGQDERQRLVQWKRLFEW